LILAAGYATRLYPLTKEYPKPLLEVSGRPIIDYIVDKLNCVDAVDEIIVVTNSKFISRFRGWKKKVKSPKAITLVDDQTKSNADRLGAIGDINFVIDKKHIKEDTLVIGGDNLFNGSLKEFLKFATDKKSAVTLGLYKLSRLKDASRYGVAKLNKENKVVYFKEKPANPESKLVAMCLYYLPGKRLGLIKDFIKVRKVADATGNYIGWIKDKIDTYGFIFSGSWYDIGDYKFLNAAQKEGGKF